jgi:hypothetical protein
MEPADTPALTPMLKEESSGGRIEVQGEAGNGVHLNRACGADGTFQAYLQERITQPGPMGSITWMSGVHASLGLIMQLVSILLHMGTAMQMQGLQGIAPQSLLHMTRSRVQIVLQGTTALVERTGHTTGQGNVRGATTWHTTLLTRAPRVLQANM